MPLLSNADDSSNGVSVANQAPAYGDPGQPAAPPASAPAAPQPGLWGRVLQGALTGLAHGGVPGALVGGVEATSPTQFAKMKVAEQQRQELAKQQVEQGAWDIKFKSAQAGAAVAQAARDNAIAAKLPQEAADAHDANQREALKDWMNMGTPIKTVSPDTHDGAANTLQGITQTEGGVGHMAVFEAGGQHYSVDLDALANAPQSIKIINDAQSIAMPGAPPVTNATYASNPAAKTQALEQAKAFWAPPPSKDFKEADGKAQYYSSLLDAAKQNSDADPALVQRLSDLTGRLQTQAEHMKKSEGNNKAQEAGLVADAQARARQNVSNEQTPAYAYDPKTKSTVAGTMAELRGTPGLRMFRKVTEANIKEDTQLNNRLADVSNKIGEYENTLQTPLSDQAKGALAQLGQDLHIEWHGVTIPTELLNAALNTETQKRLLALPGGQQAVDRLIAYRNARESMIGYQRVLSGSGRSSEQAMQLNLQALPAPTDVETIGRKAISAFKRNIGIAARGLVQLPGAPPPDVQGNLPTTLDELQNGIPAPLTNGTSDDASRFMNSLPGTASPEARKAAVKNYGFIPKS